MSVRSVVVLLVLLSFAAALPARTGIPWFDLRVVPGEVGASLLRLKHLACGAVAVDGVPLPDDVKLVFVSCNGGPHACPGRSGALTPRERQLACPPGATSRDIATMHLVSARNLEALQAFYARVLADSFAAVARTGEERASFVEKVRAGERFPWSPKRLHLSISPAGEPFRAAGYPSQIRLTLSVAPPSEPPARLHCRRPIRLKGSRPGYRYDPLFECPWFHVPGR